jgi:3-hydroxybutyrate dehydrogenase
VRGRVALVTGGASGLGQAIAERLAAGGARVAVVDRDAAGGERIAAAIGGIAVSADLTEPGAVDAVMAAVQERLGDPLIVVNNAGYQSIAAIPDFDPDRWRHMLELMLTVPFLFTRAAWAGMAGAGWGRIVNMASTHGLVASPYKSAYISAKHGLVGLTRTTALEGGSVGITANAICPGYSNTPLVMGQIADQARTLGIPEDEVIERVFLAPAAVRRLVEPSEVAEIAAWLCTDAATSVTGTAIPIDGGWTAR